jgi:hypothetical protein
MGQEVRDRRYFVGTDLDELTAPAIGRMSGPFEGAGASLGVPARKVARTGTNARP